MQAITASVAGDVVLVHPGIYEETIDFLGKSIEVRAVGSPNETIIDGGGNGSVVTFVNAETRYSVLEGFTITGGSGTSWPPASSCGGGVFCFGASPVIRGNVIVENRAEVGGGIGCVGEGARPWIESNTIQENRADVTPGGIGGGIYVEDGTSPLVSSNEISRNWATGGGSGMYIRSRDGVVVIDNRFTANESPAGSDTAGILAEYSVGLVIEANTFVGNRGWALDMLACPGGRVEGNLERGGSSGYRIEGCDDVVISRNRIESGLGDSMFLAWMKGIVVDSNIVTGRSSVGCLFRGVEATVSNNVLIDCHGRDWGGGIRATHGSSLDISHCTIVGNSSDVDGSGLLLSLGSQATVRHSILWGNEGRGIGLDNTSSVTISQSVVEGGWPGEAILDVDPELVDPGSGDYHLRLGSPCIDAGFASGELPANDVDGEARIIDGNRDGMFVPDIGADEHRPEIALRYGNVGAIGAGVLRVNGSVGDQERVMRIGRRDALEITLDPSPAGPEPGHFVLYAWIDEPDETTLTRQPFGLGWTLFPTPLQPNAGNQPVAIWNNLGYPARLGMPDLESAPAPSILLDRPQGIGQPHVVTLQGILEDAGSAAEGPASLTNAIVLRIE